MTMQYEPIKDRVSGMIRIFPAARLCFYRLLDLFLLRQRYVKRQMNRHCAGRQKLRYYDAGAGFCQYSWYVLNKWSDSTVFASDLKGDYLDDFAHFLPENMAGRFSHRPADLQFFKPEKEFDLVTAIDILEHIEDDMAVLKNFHACLAENGMLIISTPSDSDPAARFTAEHVRPGYGKAELEARLGACGFRILASLYSYGPLGSLAWRWLIKRPLSLISRSKLFLLALPIYYLPVFPIAQLLMALDLRLDNKRGTGLIIVAQKA